MEQGAGVYLEGVARVARAAGAGTTPAAQVARTVDMFTTPFGYVRSEPAGCTGVDVFPKSVLFGIVSRSADWFQFLLFGRWTEECSSFADLNQLNPPLSPPHLLPPLKRASTRGTCTMGVKKAKREKKSKKCAPRNPPRSHARSSSSPLVGTFLSFSDDTPVPRADVT